MTLRDWAPALGIAALALANAGCIAHVANETPGTGSPTATPSPLPSGASPAPSSSPNPAYCTRQSKDSTTTIVVSISPDFQASSSQYGPLFGYAVYDPTSSPTIPTSAAPITAGSTDVIQFVNIDSNTTNHSAVLFTGATGFPGIPYTFPANALPSSVGTSIGPAFWSTGELASFGSSSQEICWSQPLPISAGGTYYFGDDPLYNSISSFRGVIVAQ